MRALAPSVLLLALLGAACGGSSSSSTTSPSTATTETFSSVLQVAGVDYQNFTVTTAGAFTATLTSLDNTAHTVGFGVGIPSATGRGCYITTSITTTGGPDAQISASVDPGNYCVTIYDEGRLTTHVSFSISIAHT